MEITTGLKIRGKEYAPNHQITTTVFLEKCRVSHIACSLLIRYVNNPQLRDEIDATIKSVKSADIANLILSFRLEHFWQMELDQWLEPHELGEDGLEDEEEEDGDG